MLPKALYQCLKYEKDVDCQVLANLCTLKMYDPNSADCKALIDLSATKAAVSDFYNIGWVKGLPWMYYTNDSNKILKNSDRLTAKMSLSKENPTDGKINVLNYKLAKYGLEGEFEGFEDLTTQLQLCA